MWTFLGIVAQHASAYRINSLANVRQRIGFYFLCAWGKKNITKQTFCLVIVSCVWGYCNFVPSRTNSFPGLFPSWNVRRNFIQMTRHYTNLGSASDWSCLEENLPQQIRSLTQIWVVTRHQYGISGRHTLFCGDTSCGFVIVGLFSQAASQSIP